MFLKICETAQSFDNYRFVENASFTESVFTSNVCTISIESLLEAPLRDKQRTNIDFRHRMTA